MPLPPSSSFAAAGLTPEVQTLDYGYVAVPPAQGIFSSPTYPAFFHPPSLSKAWYEYEPVSIKTIALICTLIDLLLIPLEEFGDTRSRATGCAPTSFICAWR